VSLQTLAGIADVCIGKIEDSVLLNRARRINVATDLGYGKIGGLTLAGLNLLDITVRSGARGQARLASNLTMAGSFPQTRTVRTSAAFITNRVDGLVSNDGRHRHRHQGRGAVAPRFMARRAPQGVRR
jgi:hypothetical protein